MQPSVPPYVVDPDDPRAPPQDVWERMTADERQRVIDSLPSEFAPSETQPPEGDRHFNAKVGARDAVRGFFARVGRRIYLACELPVYYPGERMFAPDVMAVLDVDPHEREGWVVSAERKGLDFALEVHVAGDRRKDLVRNNEWYARLGIPEYFIFDRGRSRLTAFQLPTPEARAYQSVLPQAGRFASRVLGLDLVVEAGRLRFYYGTAALPEADEMIAKLEGMLEDLEARARTAEEALEEQARLRADVERRLEAALAEIERLKGSR